MNIIAEIERGIKTGSFCSVQERGEKQVTVVGLKLSFSLLVCCCKLLGLLCGSRWYIRLGPAPEFGDFFRRNIRRFRLVCAYRQLVRDRNFKGSSIIQAKMALSKKKKLKMKLKRAA